LPRSLSAEDLPRSAADAMRARIERLSPGGAPTRKGLKVEVALTDFEPETASEE
jgi:hypothetical protein